MVSDYFSEFLKMLSCHFGPMITNSCKKMISIIKQNTKFPKMEATSYLQNVATLNYFGNRARYKKIN